MRVLTRSTHKFFKGHEKSDTMWAVTPWIRRAVWLLVIYGILYLLISPLPELGAALSGKSAFASFTFITIALLQLLFQLLAILGGPACQERVSAGNLLDKICLRLC
jgi:hypothetical protein